MEIKQFHLLEKWALSNPILFWHKVVTTNIVFKLKRSFVKGTYLKYRHCYWRNYIGKDTNAGVPGFDSKPRSVAPWIKRTKTFIGPKMLIYALLLMLIFVNDL